MNTCIFCGKMFEPYYSSNNQKCCSKFCRNAVNCIKYNNVCKISYGNCVKCGKGFIKKSFSHKFCSKDCRDNTGNVVSQRKEYQFICDICGKEFVSTHAGCKRCSKECAKKVVYQKVNRNCSDCNEIFKVSKSSKQEVCFSCKEKRKRELKNTMPFVTSDLSLKNKGILSQPTNMWNIEGFSQKLKDQIKERDGWQCYICHKKTNLHVHHIIPRKDGGEHTPDNLITLCGGCHKGIESGNMEKAIEKCIIRAINNI